MNGFRRSNSFIGFGIRYLCLKKLAKSCGEKVILFPDVYIKGICDLELGNNVSIHEFCYIDASGGVQIGHHVGMGHGCSVLSIQHRYDVPDCLVKASGYTVSPVVIEEDVWLGAHVRIMPGITLGKGCVIGAGSVVTKDVPSHMIAVGVPAQTVRSRFSNDTSIQEHAASPDRQVEGG